jgi:hypothetical protein
MEKEYIPASSKDFVEYFEKNYLKDNEEEMLMLNYFSPDHTITSGMMAAAMNWPNVGSANLHYGTFSGKTAKVMGFVPPLKDQVSFFVDFNMPETEKDESHWQWIMRPELVEAIHLLGWDTEEARRKAQNNLNTAEIMLM